MRKGIIDCITIFISILFLASIPRIAASSAGIELNIQSKTLYLKGNKSVTLKAETTGSKKKIKWKSKNPQIASVKHGKVVAKRAGRTVIFAQSGKALAKCKIIVKKNDSRRNELRAYKRLLEKELPQNHLLQGYTVKKFSLLDINDDGVKEMIICVLKETEYYMIYTYINGRMKEIGRCMYPQSFFKYAKKNVFAQRIGRWGCVSVAYFQLNGGNLKKIGEKGINIVEGNIHSYYLAGKEVPKSQFYSHMDRIIGRAKPQKCKFISNTESNRNRYLG